jgi:DNA-binding Lrp family transcriptional regulator
MPAESVRRSLAALLQGDLPLVERPFAEMAKAAGTTEVEVLSILREMVEEGTIRKFGAVLRHRRAGYTRNAMVVWEVPEERSDEAGRIFAARREVTHCYRREPPFLGRYRLFTMVHFREGEGDGFLADLAAEAGALGYQVLESLEELKKTSMEYF